MRISYLLGIIFIVGLFIIAFLSYISPLERTANLSMEKESPAATLFFASDVIIPASKSASTSQIMLSTNTAVVSVQVDLSYNPQVFQNLTLKPSENNFFGDKNSYIITVLEVREDLGRATFAIETIPTAPEKKGEGAIATVSFYASPFATDQANIEFLNKSTVMVKGSRESILKTTYPLTVLFRNMNMPTNQSTASPQILGN